MAYHLGRALADDVYDHARIFGYQFLRGMNELGAFFPDEVEAGMRVRNPAYNEERMRQYWECERDLCTKIAECYADMNKMKKTEKYSTFAEIAKIRLLEPALPPPKTPPIDPGLL